jgi:predicted outer membrane repeat protein
MNKSDDLETTGLIQIGVNSRVAVDTTEAETLLRYEITFTGPGDTKIVQIPAGSPLRCTVEVIPGNWTIAIRASGPPPAAYTAAYFPAEILRASGVTSIQVNADHTSPATVVLGTTTEVSDEHQLEDAITKVGTKPELILVTGDIISAAVVTIDGGKKITLVSQGADRVITKGANNINLFKIEDPGSDLILGDPAYSAYKLELDGNSSLYSGESLVFIETSGTLTIGANAILRNNKTNGNGGGIYCDDGTIEIWGGEISGNIIDAALPRFGGGIYATNNSTIQMSSGTISTNRITTSGTTADIGAVGGGIALAANSNFEMRGGLIEHNSLSSQSAGGWSAYIGGGGVNVNTSSFTAHWPQSHGHQTLDKQPGGVLYLSLDFRGMGDKTVAYKPLEVDRETKTIMGVSFEGVDDFEAVLNSIGTNMFEGFEPSAKKIEIMRDYVMKKITLPQLIKLCKEKAYAQPRKRRI